MKVNKVSSFMATKMFTNARECSTLAHVPTTDKSKAMQSKAKEVFRPLRVYCQSNLLIKLILLIPVNSAL